MRLWQLVIASVSFGLFLGFGAIGLGVGVAAHGQPVAIGQAMVQPNPQAGGPPVVLVAPAQPAATIDTGSIAGQAITWAMAVFGPVLATMGTAWLYKLFQKAGVDLSQAQRDRLQEIAENGLQLAAHEFQTATAGKGQIEVRNKVLADAGRYTQLHGADTLKALGHDPTSVAAVDAIKARMLAAINNPDTPTPPILEDTPMPITTPVTVPVPRPVVPPPPPAPTTVVKA